MSATGTGATTRTRMFRVAGHAAPWRNATTDVARRSTIAVHAMVVTGFLFAGIVVTWPRATDLFGQIPATRDAGSYVWGFWWFAHQIEHLGNPWFTHSIAAPVGTPLGFHALMPLGDLLMLPVTLVLGPVVSYNLLSVAMPGLLSYAAYRAARLWLPSQTGAIAAGVCFGLSSMLTWRAWYHLNLAAGVLFFPIALEVAVRLQRRPDRRQAVMLGLVLGASLLTDQQMSVLTFLLTALAVAPWLRRGSLIAKLRLCALTAVVAVLLASPQLVAMASQAGSGGASSPAYRLGADYVDSGASLDGMFAVSPRAADFGLGEFTLIDRDPTKDGIHTFGLLLTGLAIVGLLLAWRRRSARLLGLLWLGCAVMSLGAVLKFGGHSYVPLAQTLDGHRVSAILPFTWFVQLPMLSGFREASRVMMLGLLPAALLAGAAVEWLRRRASWALVAVGLLAILELGWSGDKSIGTVQTALPAVDRAIAADHSGSLVVDVPYGIRGGTNFSGGGFDPDAQVLATVDGHPRAVGFVSRVSSHTLSGLDRDAFFTQLRAAQLGQEPSSAELAAATRNAYVLHVGWVLLWSWLGGHAPAVRQYVESTGFHLDYSADGVLVYRAASLR